MKYLRGSSFTHYAGGQQYRDNHAQIDWKDDGKESVVCPNCGDADQLQRGSLNGIGGAYRCAPCDLTWLPGG